jgi:xyloglucan:xyloglucosyl transferase
MAFSEDYDNLWGPQHQTLSQDKMALTLLMDRTSGQYVWSFVVISS